MTFQAQREQFERECKIYEAHTLTFQGVDGFDVYNCSIPFEYGGKRYIFGRVERREEWARSWTRLFEQVKDDIWRLVPDSMIYPLEDPYVQFINGELTMGGTHTRFSKGKLSGLCAYFYKGALDDLVYFTTGPKNMKDIRLIQLKDGRIGVFSRPRGEAVERQYPTGHLRGWNTPCSPPIRLYPMKMDSAPAHP